MKDKPDDREKSDKIPTTQVVVSYDSETNKISFPISEYIMVKSEDLERMKKLLEVYVDFASGVVDERPIDCIDQTISILEAALESKP